MSISIYSPAVRAEALRYGITDLQAYRKLQARELILRQEQEKRRAIIQAFVAEQPSYQDQLSAAAKVDPNEGRSSRFFNWLSSKIPADWHMH